MFIEKDNLIKIWENKLLFLSPSETFNVYIDNPFCLRECKYCIYSPYVTKINSEVYNKYYNEFLPSQIKDFNKILEMKTPDTIYFGGGTASLMTSEIMKNIFDIIPSFKSIPNKVFECHPATVTKEKLDLFIENKFSYVSFGVQSMKKDVIESQNRIVYDFDKLKENIQYLQDSNIKVNCDLLAFMETQTANDLTILGEDIDECIEKLSPDWITVFPMYQAIYSQYSNDNINVYDNEEQKNDNLDKIIKLRRVLLKSIRRHSHYHIVAMDNFFDKGTIINNSKKNYFITKLTDEEFHKTKVYSCSGFPHQPANQNVLGLGGMFGDRVYSYLGRDFLYNTVNDNWETKFDIVENNIK